MHITKDGSIYNISIDGKGDYTIDANGKVEKSGPTIQITQKKIVANADGTGDNITSKDKIEGTDTLYISFVPIITGGNITSVKYNGNEIMPQNGIYVLEVSKNGDYTFAIIGTVDGETISEDKSIKVSNYNIRAGIKVGDYIKYTSPTASVSLSTDETGYTDEQILPAKNMFRVMDIDDNGNMKLMGVITSSDPCIGFRGARGYNNAVYVLNKKCSDLYKNEAKGITARSINEEDITKRFNTTGKKKMTDYINERVGNIETPTSNTLSVGGNITAIDKTNKTITFVNSTYYPNIFQYEEGGKIGDTATGIPETNPSKSVARSESYNGYGSDGILTNADKDKDNNIISQSLQSNTTLTIPYTYYNTSHDVNDFNYEEELLREAYNNMFFEINTEYWLASRCIGSNSDYVYFFMRTVNKTSFDTKFMFGSVQNAGGTDIHVCPIVTIPSSVEVQKTTGTTSSTNYHEVK